jgi:TP901 family phage tail tape measure protein
MATEITSLSLNVNSSSVGKAADELDRLSKAAKGSEKSTDGLAKETKKATGASGKYYEAQDKLTGAQKKYNASTSLASNTTAQLATKMGKVLAPIAILTAGLVGLNKSVQTFAKLEASLSGVAAVTGATADEMAELTRTARELGAVTQFSAAQAADGMRFLGQAGFKTNDIIASMPGLLDLAAAGQLDLAEASDIATNVLSGFQLEASDTGRVADVLAKAAASSNTNVQQLGEAMSYAAPIAAAMGISVESAAAAIGVFSDNGIQGSRAGTGFNTMMASLASATPEAEKALKGLGLSLEDVNPKTNSLTDILKKLRDGGLDTSNVFKIFGREAAPAILAITSKVGNFEKLNTALLNGKGAASDMADILSNNLEGAYKRLNSASEEFQITLAESIGASNLWREAVELLAVSLNGLSKTISGDRSLNELVASYDRISNRIDDVDKRALPSFRKSLNATTDALSKFSEEEKNIARLENRIAGLVSEEEDLNDVLKRGRRESLSAFNARVAERDAKKKQVQESIEGYEKEITKIQQVISERERLNKLFSEALVPVSQTTTTSVTVTPKGEAPSSTSSKTSTTPPIDSATGTGGLSDTRSQFSSISKFNDDKKEFQSLVDSLKAEEVLIQESYLNRIEMIRKNTLAGSEARAELEAKAQKRYDEDLTRFEERTIREVDIQKNGWMLELEELDAHFNRRRELILENTALSEEERTALTLELTEQRNDLVNKLERERINQGLSMASNYFSNFTALAESNNSNMARIGKAAGKAQQAVAIAQTTMKTYESATSAYNSMAGIPYVGPILGAAAAAGAVAMGLANVAQIKSQGFQSGGFTGNVGVSDVAGVVHGQEFVVNAGGTAKNRGMLEAMNRGEDISKTNNTGMALNITVENYGSSQITVDRVSENDVRIIAREVATETVRNDAPGVVAGDISNPNGKVSKSLSKNTTMQRKR